jgi:hypothetical protein
MAGLVFCQCALFFRCVSCCRLWHAWSAPGTTLLSCEAYPDCEQNCAVWSVREDELKGT